MSLIANGAGEQPTGFYNGVATQSLRFNDDDNANLKFDPSGASNQKTWVCSAWVKKTANGNNPADGNDRAIFTTFTAGNNANCAVMGFRSDKPFYSTYGVEVLVATQVCRDLSAWYHLVWALDTRQATNTNRLKIYLNGVAITSFSVDNRDNAYLDQDNDLAINNGNEVRIGNAGASSNPIAPFDGYIAEMNFIDGQSFFSDTSGTANSSFNINSFGELKNGVWIPIKYSGSYGTNGFRLQFNQSGVGTASTSTIGADTSGNTNHFTSSGIVASDCAMPDSPENNFATLNPLYFLTASTHLSEGNLQLTHEATAHRAHAGTMFSKTGKWYFEVRNKTDTAGSSVALGVGLQDTSKNLVYASGADNYVFYANNNRGKTVLNTTEVTWSTDGTHAPDAGDIIQVAYDADSGKIFFGIDNTYYAADAGADGNPATGDNPSATLSTTIDYIPFVGTYNNEATANFGQDSSFAGTETAQGNTDANGIGDFFYEPPNSFLALCSFNLLETTISPNSDTQADDHFNTVLWTGNGQSGQAITGVGFNKPDWVWIKERNSTSSHALYDSSRGVKKQLESNTTDAETNYDSNLLSFDTDGFTLGGSGATNQNNNTYVGWNWKANGGTTSSNTDGSITSTVQANTTAGFSIVLYAGSESNATVGHGLGGVPDMLIWKKRNGVNDWIVYHSANTSEPATDHLHLNLTNATNDQPFFQDTLPTSTVFSIGTDDDVNDAKNYVVYCFRSIEGYSKFGSYTGNGNADGAFVHLGFRPAFFMTKRTDTANNWVSVDTAQNTFNVTDAGIQMNTNLAQGTGYANDFLSNGMKIRNSGATVNASGGTYIYMAFAEAPFKYANAK